MSECAHCNQPVMLDRNNRASGDLALGVDEDVLGTMTKQVMYACPHCDSVLGFRCFLGGFLTGRP